LRPPPPPPLEAEACISGYTSVSAVQERKKNEKRNKDLQNYYIITTLVNLRGKKKF